MKHHIYVQHDNTSYIVDLKIVLTVNDKEIGYRTESFHPHYGKCYWRFVSTEHPMTMSTHLPYRIMWENTETIDDLFNRLKELPHITEVKITKGGQSRAVPTDVRELWTKFFMDKVKGHHNAK